MAHADVLAVAGERHPNTIAKRTMVEVQVKTLSYNRVPKWPIGGNWMVRAASAHEWFVFVLLGAERANPPALLRPPTRSCGSRGLDRSYGLAYRTGGGCLGKRNTPIERVRVGVNVFERFEERWDLIEEPTGRR